MSKKSFTLIEILVSIIIFIIIIGTILDLAVLSLKVQQRNLTEQYLLNQVDYTIEYISRQLRMAKRDDNGICLTNAGCTYESISSRTGIKFVDHNGICTTIKLSSSGQIEKNNIPLTSSDFQVSNFRVKLRGECNDDTTQPQVTVTFGVSRDKNSSKVFQFQTTVSQRNLDYQ